MKKTPVQIDQFRPFLSPSGLRLAQAALQRMAESKDPYHDLHHIGRMLKDLRGLSKAKIENLEVHPEIMVLSILWHDTWKAQRIANNVLDLIHHQLMDGLGSAALFATESKLAGLTDQIRQAVTYSIRKHAQFQFRPVVGLEAQLLRDLDDLDLLSIERLEKGKIQYPFSSPWRLKIFRKAMEYKQFHTDWAKEEQTKRQHIFFEKLNHLIQQSAAPFILTK
jgi:hypothetical protein